MRVACDPCSVPCRLASSLRPELRQLLKSVPLAPALTDSTSTDHHNLDAREGDPLIGRLYSLEQSLVCSRRAPADGNATGWLFDNQVLDLDSKVGKGGVKFAHPLLESLDPRSAARRAVIDEIIRVEIVESICIALLPAKPNPTLNRSMSETARASPRA